jgi:hypothetical protein
MSPSVLKAIEESEVDLKLVHSQLERLDIEVQQLKRELDTLKTFQVLEKWRRKP